MNQSDVSTWRHLYELGEQFAKLKPWQKMCNDNVIKITPEGMEPGYFSILGNGGFEFGFILYQGEKGFHTLMNLFHRMEENITEEYSQLTQSCIAFFIADKEELIPEQIELINALGMKFKGRKNWQYFESYEPGYIPYLLTMEEAENTIAYFEGLLSALDDIKKNKVSLGIMEMYDFACKDGKWTGKKEYLNMMEYEYHIPEPEPLLDSEKQKAKEWAKVKKKKENLSLLADFIMTPITESPKGKPYMPLWIGIGKESDETILDFRMLNPTEEPRQAIIDLLDQYISKCGRPGCIYVENRIIAGYVQELLNLAEIKLAYESDGFLRYAFEEIQYGHDSFDENGDEMTPESVSNMLREMAEDLGMSPDEMKASLRSEGHEFEAQMLDIIEEFAKDPDAFMSEDDDDFFDDDFDGIDFDIPFQKVETRTQKQKLEAIHDFFGQGALDDEDYEEYEKIIAFETDEKSWEKRLNQCLKKDLVQIATELGVDVKPSDKKEELIKSISAAKDDGIRMHQFFKSKNKKLLKMFFEQCYDEVGEIDLEDFEYTMADIIDLLKAGIIDIMYEYDEYTLYLTIMPGYDLKCYV